MQLPLSSKMMAPAAARRVHSVLTLVKKLDARERFLSAGRSQTPLPMAPERRLFASTSSSTAFIPTMEGGISPPSSLKLASKTVAARRRPTPVGRQPENMLLRTTNSLRVRDMLPTDGGMFPWNMLLARTMTEAGEEPMESGRSHWKRLSFTKMASKVGLVKSSAGNEPEKRLKRRSK